MSSDWRDFHINDELSPEFVPRPAPPAEKKKGRRRGNPNGGQRQPLHVACGAELTAFERFVLEQQVPEADWARSHRVRAWVRKHFTKRYVPEWLILECGLDPEKATTAGLGIRDLFESEVLP